MRRIGLTLLSSASLLALAGCDTVQLNYRAPSSDSTQVLADAQDGYHYFELPRSYIVLTKANGTAASGNASDSNSSKNGSPPKTNVAGGSNGVPVNGGHGHANMGQGTGHEQSQAQPQTNSGTDQANGSSSTSPLPSWPNQTIGPDTWAVSVIPVASGEGLLVKGRVNYWQSTTLGVARYENTDMPSTISSKAENLVAKRIGQGFSLLTDIAGLSAHLLVAGSASPAPSGLQPFSLRVTGAEDQGSVNSDWDWKLTYDNGQVVPEAVPYKNLLSSADNAAVGYWPIPACREATLTLIDKNHKTAQGSYDFHVAVGTPEWVRLEPLPVDGSLTLDSVCSASTKGTTDADPGTDAFNIADGFAKGIESLGNNSKPTATAPAHGN